MTKVFYVYVVAVAAAALGLAGQFPWSDLASLGLRDGIGLSAFVLAAIAAEAFALGFSGGSPRAKQINSSITFLIFFACAIVFPPAAAVLTVIMVLIVSEAFLRRHPFIAATFNVVQSTLAISLALLVYIALGGYPGGEYGVQLIPFAGLAATFFATNLLLVSSAFAIREGQSLVEVVRQAVGPAGGNLFYDLLASPVALVAAIVYRELHEPGLVMVLLPLLLIRSSYISQMKLQQVNRDLLRVLVKAIETRDPYTSGHSVRVSVLARAIAEDLGLSRKRVELVEIAALLHDIGKIDRVYAELIMKSSTLSDTELAVIRTHATKGADLLNSLTSLDDDVIMAVRHHHERYDGKGYPAGLAGKAIPIGARIIMLCDSIDAMLSDRPYRQALSINEVKAELRRCAGTQFDPELVAVILRHGTLERAARLIPPKEQPEPVVVLAHA